MVNIVLHEPEMPANTGNIGRTCVATGSVLHLIEPLGFKINDKMLKRAGLDYWDKLDVRTYVNFEDFLAKNPGAKIYMATTKSKQTYTDVEYEDGCYIMFGKRKAPESRKKFFLNIKRQQSVSDARAYPFTESWKFCSNCFV